MLRPATPLAVLLFGAFVMLLISVLSTPIVQSIPLGTFEDANFGVFGYCNKAGCSPIEIGYDTSKVLSPSASKAAAFDLSSSTRATLSAILVVHPIAAFFTLVMFALAVVAHFHAASHSARYLLLLFIVSLVDFLLCLLSFLIDVLLFVPHMAWGSYIVLAATIMVAFSSLVSCAMRRTVVGRKARQKRIAANAEMSGENFFNRQAQQAPVAAPAASMQPTVPVLSGANGNGRADGDVLPEFAAFEKKDDRSSDERIPLTARSPSQRSPNNLPSDLSSNPADIPPGGPGGPLQRSNSAPPVQFDQYGNPIPGPPDGYGMRRGPSFERMNSRGRGGMPPGYRGRGGYSPGPGRGGYNGYGPPPGGRGGYGSQRGGYGPPPQGGRGGYGPPPRGYGSQNMRGGRPPPPGYQSGPYDRRGSPAAGYQGPPYGREPSPGELAAPGYRNASNPSLSGGNYEAYNPDRGSLPRAESPPPLPGAGVPGQAVELDAASGSPSHPPQNFDQFGIRASDTDVAGMLALQQARATSPRARETYASEDSRYSQEEGAYVPPRQAWNQGSGRNSPRMPSPLNVPGRTAELRASPGPQQPPPQAGEYYEDVDPRFAEPPTVQRPTPPPPIQTANSYEDIPQGERSPAESERSTFTSISQRGVNPRWNPPPPPPSMTQGGYGQHLAPRRPANRNEILLNSNPDFELPAARNVQPKATGPGMIPGSAYPTGPL